MTSLIRVDRLQPFDQRHMGARQCAACQFGLDQRAERGKFLDPFVGQFGRPTAARRRSGSTAPSATSLPNGLARRRHGHAISAPYAAQRHRLARRDLAVHDPGPQRAVDAVMSQGLGGQGLGLGRTAMRLHGRNVITCPPTGQSVNTKRCSAPPCVLSQRLCRAWSGQSRATVSQKAGEWSMRARCATSCAAT
jgi:hypothetical protein